MALKRFKDINEGEAVDKQIDDVDPNSIEAHITKVIDPLIEKVKSESYQNPGGISNAEVLGLIVSKYLRWDGADIAETAKSAFIDANYDDLANKLP